MAAENNILADAQAVALVPTRHDFDENAFPFLGNDKIEAVETAIGLFNNGLTERVTKLVLQFNAWFSLWDGNVTVESMMKAMHILGELFFGNTFPSIRIKCVDNLVRDTGKHGSCKFDANGVPILITLDTAPWKAWPDRRSGFISVLLHELCHAYLGPGPDRGSGHDLCWFYLAASVETVARWLFPKLSIRLAALWCFLWDCASDHGLGKRECDERLPGIWYKLVLQFSDDEMDDFLRSMYKEDEDDMNHILRVEGHFDQPGGIRAMVKKLQNYRDKPAARTRAWSV